MENSPTEKPAKRKKNSLCAFFRSTWLAVKSANQCRRRGNKVAPLQPVSDTDSADPQCGPSGLESTAPWHVADPQPDPSSLEPTTIQDQTDPPPDPFSVTSTNCDENPSDPELAEVNQTNKKKKKQHICGFFRRTWRAVKCATTQRKKHNKVAPLYPQPNPDPADSQLDQSILEPTALQNPGDFQPDPNILEPMALQDLADPQPDPDVLEPTAPRPDPNVFEPTALRDPAKSQPDLDNLEPTALWGPVDPQLDPNFLEPTALQDLADPQPDPDVLEPTAQWDPADPQSDPNILEPTFLWDPADPQPDPNVLEPMALRDPAKPQPDQNILEPSSLQDPADPQPDSNILELTALQHPADPPEDPQPDSSNSDQDSDQADSYPGQACVRAAYFTDPTPVPFDEIYEVGEEIGEGGFGAVYEGISKLLREQVAIKIIPKCGTDRYIEIPGCSKPLFAEVAVNLLLKQPPLSPYIVHMLEWFEEEDRFILILEYPQPCKDLLKFMVNNMQRGNESQIRSLIYQAVLAAKHCLNQGIFHRDIKLNNLLINTKTNQVKLIDFGCSDLVKPSAYLGDFIGGVCPPEYYKDLKYEAGPTTVWSLGIMMYTMVCRCQPFMSVEDMHGSLSFNVRVSTELQDLISRCLTYHPTERATIEEILEHEWFQQGQTSGVA
ncbi:hypothetical protein Q8A67_016739 [Cirrhinus molitorella]|uniref:non-specific serine/threonine protein kinase n=1 Tax=Cirrhinus molitorella TaxID=172907 RepID=A0AA88TJF9_9TELE|nr:hypothetical protein Q8A67_016739 [Cirrhinus molitorella]